MTTVILCCLCHNYSASILLYFTFWFYVWDTLLAYTCIEKFSGTFNFCWFGDLLEIAKNTVKQKKEKMQWYYVSIVAKIGLGEKIKHIINVIFTKNSIHKRILIYGMTFYVAPAKQCHIGTTLSIVCLSRLAFAGTTCALQKLVSWYLSYSWPMSNDIN